MVPRQAVRLHLDLVVLGSIDCPRNRASCIGGGGTADASVRSRPSSSRQRCNRRSGACGAVDSRSVSPVRGEDLHVHLPTCIARDTLRLRCVGEQRERAAADGGVALLVGQDGARVDVGGLGIDVTGQPDQRLESFTRLCLPGELEHGQALQHGSRPARHEPVEQLFPLGQRAIRVGVLAEIDQACAQELPVAVLVVELAGQQLPNLALAGVGDPRGQQLAERSSL